MLIPYSKIVGAKIVELRGQTLLGEVCDLVISKTSMTLMGVTLRNTTFFPSPVRVISATDIEEFTPIEVTMIVNHDEVIEELNETIRLKNAYDQGFTGIGQTVVTKSGKHIGKVYDYLITNDDFRIQKFYTKSLLSDRIIPIKSVIGFEKKKLIIKDDFATLKMVMPIAETSGA